MVPCVVLCCWLLGLPARWRPAALRVVRLRRTRWAPHAGESSAHARRRWRRRWAKPHEMCAWSRMLLGPVLALRRLGALRAKLATTVPYGFDKKLSSAHKQRAAQAPSSRRTPRTSGRHEFYTTGRAGNRSLAPHGRPGQHTHPLAHTKQNGQRHVHGGRETTLYCGHGQRHTNRKEGDGHDPEKFRRRVRHGRLHDQ